MPWHNTYRPAQNGGVVARSTVAAGVCHNALSPPPRWLRRAQVVKVAGSALRGR